MNLKLRSIFRLSEAEFMEFAEIENHDDFYSVDEKEFVHVQDQRGFYVVYDSALTDLKYFSTIPIFSITINSLNSTPPCFYACTPLMYEVHA